MTDIAVDRTLDSLLAAVREQLVPCIGAGTFDALSARAAGIPLEATRLLGLEVPIGARDGPADLLLSLVSGRQLSLLRESNPDLARRLGGGAELESLLDALSDDAHPLFGRVADAWVEYDVGSGDPRIPSLFCHPREAADTKVAGRLLGGDAPVDKVLDHLAEDELVQQIGVMLGRGERGVRLVLTSRTGSAPGLGAVRSAGWDGPAEIAFARYGRLANQRSLAVSMAPDGALSRGAGIELHLRTLDVAERVLSALVADGLADEARVGALCAWHGHAHDSRAEVTPAGFGLAAELTRGRAKPAIVRRIHHVKLTVGAGAPPTAKAYLGVRPYLVF